MINVEHVVSVLPMKTHISLFPNEQLDRLVNQHIFHQSKMCTGPLAVSISPVLYRCRECSALIEPTTILDIDGKARHTRAIPYFSTGMAPAWSIIESLQARSDADQACFVLFLDAQIRGEFLLRNPLGKVKYSLQRFTFGMTPRLICIAALQAVGAADVDGYLVESEAEQ